MGEELCPDLPWARIRALGNMLRHEYDAVDPIRVWLLVEDDLTALEAAVTAALEKIDGKT